MKTYKKENIQNKNMYNFEKNYNRNITLKIYKIGKLYKTKYI